MRLAYSDQGPGSGSGLVARVSLQQGDVGGTGQRDRFNIPDYRSGSAGPRRVSSAEDITRWTSWPTSNRALDSLSIAERIALLVGCRWVGTWAIARGALSRSTSEG